MYVVNSNYVYHDVIADYICTNNLNLQNYELKLSNILSGVIIDLKYFPI